MVGLSRSERRDRLWKSMGGKDLEKPWPALVGLYYGWCGLGRDMNGATLYCEREAWLANEANGWSEAGAREAGGLLFARLECTSAEISEMVTKELSKGK